MSTSLYWFRNDLRVTDLPGLLKACEQERVLAAYCFDPREFGEGDYGFRRTGPFRAAFLLESVRALQQRLAELRIPFYVFCDRPEEVLPGLVRDEGVAEVHSQREWTRDEVQVSRALSAALPAPVQWHEHYGQFLFHPDDIPFRGFSGIPEVFTAFRKACEKHARIREPLPAPAPRKAASAPENAASGPGEALSAKARGKESPGYAPGSRLPELRELGFDPPQPDRRSAFPFRGGEDAAWQRLQDYFWETRRLSAYKRTRNGLLGTDYSSKFSPWLANGSLSPRQIHAEVRRYEVEITRNRDTYWMIFELIWRDYFKYVSLKHGDRIFHPGGIRGREPKWEPSDRALREWTRGETGDDFINANMKELLLTGWMSNRGRQNVASYWSQTLKQDWRTGAAWFQYLLLDYDVHSNWGNWMYNSAVGNDPRQRSFNPSLQASRYDPDGRFRRRWLQPSLFDTPAE